MSNTKHTVNSDSWSMDFGEKALSHMLYFYESYCMTSGEAQEVTEIGEINEENVDRIIDLAMEAGFTPIANRAQRAFEAEMIAVKANDGNPKVFTSFYGNMKVLKMFGIVPVRIAIFAPRYTPSHQAYLDLAPTKDMLNRLKAGTMTSPEYKELFYDKLDRLNAKTVYKELTNLGGGKDVAILCYERPPDLCHREYVAEWMMREAGLKLEELPF